MANQVAITEPQFRVPTVELPSPGSAAAQVAAQAAQSAQQLYNVVDERMRKDANANAVKKIAYLRNEFTEQILRDEAQGNIIDGYADDLTNQFTQRAREMADGVTPHEMEILMPAFAGLEGDISRAGVTREVAAAGQRRFNDTAEAIGTFGTTAFKDPGQFPDLHEQATAAVTAFAGTPQQKAALRKEVHKIGENAIMAIAAGDPVKAKALITNSPEAFDLDFDRLPDIARTLDAMVNTRDAVGRAKKAEANVDAQMMANADTQSRMLTGVPVVKTPEQKLQMQDALTPHQFAMWQNEASRSDQIYDATQGLPQQTPEAMRASLAKLKPIPGTADFPSQNAAYTAAKKVAADIIDERTKDPAASVQTAFPNVSAAWDAFDAQPSNQTLQAVVKESYAAQDAVGVPKILQKPLPELRALGLAQNIMGASPEGAYNTLRQTAQQLGPYWNATFAQMAKHLDANTKVAAVIDNPIAASTLLSISRQTQSRGGTSLEELRRNLRVPASGGGSIIASLANDASMKNFRASAAQLPGGGKTSDDILSATEVLALGYMQNFGQGQAEATQNALKATLTDKYTFGYTNGHVFHIPKKYDVSAVQRGAMKALARLDATGLAIETPREGVTREAMESQVLTPIKRHGYWVTNENASGLILFSPRGVPVIKNGRDIVLGWDALAQIAAHEPAPIAPAQTKPGDKPKAAPKSNIPQFIEQHPELPPVLPLP